MGAGDMCRNQSLDELRHSADPVFNLPQGQNLWLPNPRSIHYHRTFKYLFCASILPKRYKLGIGKRDLGTTGWKLGARNKDWSVGRDWVGIGGGGCVEWSLKQASLGLGVGSKFDGSRELEGIGGMGTRRVELGARFGVGTGSKWVEQGDGNRSS